MTNIQDPFCGNYSSDGKGKYAVEFGRWGEFECPVALAPLEMIPNPNRP
jgi:hypothetical protein